VGLGPVCARNRTWGSTPQERAAAFPCDALLPDADDVLFRAVTVRAPAAVVYRWLCQLRFAPYSYDLVDNLGRRSPRRLVPGAEELAVGQWMMTVFRLAAFEPGHHLTLASRGHAVFGDVVATYRVEPEGPRRCRLVVKLLVRYPRGVVGRLGRWWLPPGDLVMMRRQLLTLRALAERTVAGDGPGGGAPARVGAGQPASR
jgi:hypothetical protein